MSAPTMAESIAAFERWLEFFEPRDLYEVRVASLTAPISVGGQ